MIGRKFKLKKNSQFTDGLTIHKETILTVVRSRRVFEEGEDSIYQVCDFMHNGKLYEVELIDLVFLDDTWRDKLDRLKYHLLGYN